jgi:N-acylneuraminate cytidylyltransferase
MYKNYSEIVILGQRRNMKNIFIIPARSGSKGLLDKNIKPVNGIPMFVWSIIHAKYMADENDIICVSSDSEQYLSIAKKWGADVHLRPSNLAQDNTDVEPVLIDVCKNFEIEDNDNIILLQPTSPLRSKETLNKYKKLIKKNCNSILSLSETYGFEWEKNNKQFSRNYEKRLLRQEMSPRFIENGSFYLNKYNLVLKNSKNNDTNRNDKISEGVVLDDVESMQVDNMQELEIIKFLSNSFNSQWLEQTLESYKIKCIFSDIDGVFAKNEKTTNSNNRIYSTLDSSAIKNWTSSNKLFFFISSETVTHSEDLFDKLNITDYIFNSQNKLNDVKALLQKHNLEISECVYLGNDSSDIDCLDYFDLSFTPADSNSKASNRSKFIIEKNGGDGFIQETINLIGSN